ncbi:type I restriction endonuclease subunit R [Adlercreutzia sp. ZJ141]|uniref:type I restriction endonuclease subunit R n=1 Tax=Adlercreutzia sp. ZJ141 TaxID=2709406 RepID=UPI0013EDC220|nr:type I restriction endonuclease [Adlercreutzia sp. ZJ141]
MMARVDTFFEATPLPKDVADNLREGDVFIDGDNLYEYKPFGKTSDHAFENDVERFLENAGWRTFREEREAGNQLAGQHDYDRKLALKTHSLISFIKETQPDEWAKIEKLYGAKTEARFLARVNDVLEPHQDQDGLIRKLRDGFSMAPGASFRLCYFKPATDRNPDLVCKYLANRFEVVRQLRYGTMHSNRLDSIDVVLFLNGIPVVTMELKNNLTGQRTANAAKQYAIDRDPKELIFKPNRRSIVHFALDSEAAEMTTWLAGKKTVFLPFNRGNGKNGGGNPPNPKGYRTEYLYRDVLAPDSLLDILQRFVRIVYNPETKYMTKVIFPRYHQLDAVRKLTADARENGSGKNYLVQHSAGSGKSNSIAWLAHHLSTLHNAENQPVFDTVVVLTDRRNLDSQLSADVEAIDHKRGVVVRVTEADGSAGLREALNSGAKIITSTIQKFPYICNETKVAGRTFAVIIDEAHSSQTGKAHAKMKVALTEPDFPDPNDLDAQDELLVELNAQGTLPNLSIFAFTATPKAATLEVFGVKDENGENPKPFHLYSMKQAIQEGFILDVLDNYTVYDTYFKLAKTIQDDPRYKESKANRALMKLVTGDPLVLQRRAAIIVEHFAENVAGDLGRRAKAMVVCSSRPAALRYWRAINAYMKDNGFAFGALVAFSGTVADGDEEWTETKCNGFSDSQTAERFDTDDYQILVCANKFQTGFDQPKLEAMYVDKALTGVAAVQTLSRLNRCYPKKRTYVLDFANDWETIQSSFSDYYEATELDNVTDLNVVYDIRQKLDGYHVYDEAEIDRVSDIWFTEGNHDVALRQIEGVLSAPVDRWKALEDDDKRLFKAYLKKFLKGYSFITQMIALSDEDMHRFFVFGGHLMKKLYLDTGGSVDLRDKVEMEYLRIENKGTKSIELEATTLHNSNATPSVHDEEKEYLSKLVDQMNERFGTNWQDADKIIRACADKIMEDSSFVAKARSNAMSDLAAVFTTAMTDALFALLAEGGEMAEAFSRDPNGYRTFLNENLLPFVYRKCNENQA